MGMENNKLRRALAIVALVFMVIFSITLVITLLNPRLYHGAFSYTALVSGLLGIGLFLVIRFLLKEKEPPEYLPKDENGTPADAQASDGAENAAEDTPAARHSDTERSADTKRD